MLVGKDWKVEADPMNIILLKRSQRLAGKPERWNIKGYYPTIKQALKALVGFKVRETELKDLKTIVNELNRLEKLIDSIKTIPQTNTEPREGGSKDLSIVYHGGS